MKGEIMSTTVEFSSQLQTDRELTVADAKECAAMIEELAVRTFMARGRVVETTVREWLVANRAGSPTTRVEFDEAVRRYLGTKWRL